MKILLDTHILLWAAAGELHDEASVHIENPENLLLFSPASLWEIAIKRSLGRVDYQADPSLIYSGLLNAGYEELSITGKHTILVGTLPQIHKDPFDRILLAQAASEGIPLLTSDETLSHYPNNVIFIPKG